MNIKYQNSKIKFLLILSTIYYLLSTFLLCGCDAFRKKFVRKPKGHRQIRVVVNTQEYPLQYSQEELYKKYLIYWRASHDELVLTLNTEDTSFKKRRHHAEKIIENLEQMRQLLPAELQVSLDVLILKQQDILSQLSRRKLSRTQRLQIISLLKKQKRQIQKEFNCPKIQEYLEEK